MINEAENMAKIFTNYVKLIVLCVVLQLIATVAWSADNLLWVEGESASSSDFKPHSWYSDAVDKGQLSGGKWITTYQGPAGAVATYTVDIPAAGVWKLWLRANPIQAGLEWRVGGGAWQAVDVKAAQDQVNIASDGKPDLRFIAWMPGGSATIAKGRTTISVRTTSKLDNHAGIDVLVLTNGTFFPAGKNPPGKPLTDAAPGWFAFDPGIDDMSPAELDLRHLNEKRAGDRGRLMSKGDDIIGGDGKPVRLWAVNASSHDGEEATRYLMARLAKNGVNLVRYHGLIADRNGNVPGAIDARKLDDLHRNIAAAADQGIYTHLSTYFPLWMKLKPSDGIEGGAMGKDPFGLLLFHPVFQTHWKAWAKAILTSKNPYTGRTVADDPAVAFFEIQNEDSLLFWTANKDALGAGPWRLLGQRFATWAIAKHGSLDAARAVWSGERHSEDSADHLGLYNLWDLTADGRKAASPSKRLRAADQLTFFANTTSATYRELTAFLRQECGFKGIVTASNWQTADQRSFGLLERLTYTETDVIDRHGYFGGKHEGDSASWSVRNGHTFVNRAAVLEPAATPLGYLQIAGRPHICSEIFWNKPNRYNADGALLTASYAALQGIDGFFQFAVGSGTWSKNGGDKWPVMMPGAIGQWPAAALQFRRGDVSVGPIAIRTLIDRADASTDPVAGGVEEGRNDDFRTGASGASGSAAYDPLAYFVGRVDRVITGQPWTPKDAKPVSADLSKAINRDGKIVTSLTGQLRWDYSNGVVRIDTPNSQAVTGFLSKAGAVKLGQVTIASGSEYGTVHVISLDNLPIATSKRILIQAFTEEQMFGFRVEKDKIIDIGRAPINVREIDARVTFENANGMKAIALDGHGRAAGTIALTNGTIVLPKDRLYVLVTR